MENQKTKILVQANELKEKLVNWRNEIIYKLEDKMNEKVNIFLIDKDLFDENIETPFKVSEKELFKQLIKENHHNSQIKKEIDENSKFYILNEKCWNFLFGEKFNELKNIYEGYFLNKILLFSKEHNYFFLYLDEKKEIKKGCFKIDKEINDMKNVILNYFRENEPMKKDELFNTYHIKYKILEDNSILEYKYNEEDTKFNNNFEQYKNMLGINSYNGNNNKNNDKENGNENSFYKKIQFQKKDEIRLNQVINNQQKGSKNFKERDELTYKSKNYVHKKFNEANNKPPSFKEKKEEKNQKKNADINLRLKNFKDIFDPKTKIIKRNPSAKNKKSFTSNNVLNKIKNFNLNEFLPKKALHKLYTPGVKGLNKISNIPFINATLQCLSNVQRLKSELIKKEVYEVLKKNIINKRNISFYLAEVLKNLWEDLSVGVYEPKNFVEKIKEIESNKPQIFKQPIYLIEFLLKEIHNELNESRKLNVEVGEDTNLFQSNNLSKKFNIYKKKYQSSNNSIISKEFIGHYTEIKGCYKCKNIYFNDFNHFQFLSFPLEQIRHFHNYNCNYVKIYDCFEYYQRIQPFVFNCYKCSLQMNIYTNFLNLPKTLIINFEYNGNNSIKIVYEEFLNLKKFVKMKDSPFYYELIGVICYANSNNENNFIAYCKNENCKWYKYNDCTVTTISFGEIEGLPYVLFFSYIQV